MLLFKGGTIGEQIKAQSNIILELEESIAEKQKDDLLNKVKNVTIVDAQSVRFVSKEESLTQMKQDEDYSMILDSINPFLDMILFNLNKDHYSKKNIELLESIVMSWDKDYKVIYENNFGRDINAGLSKLKVVLLLASILFAFLTIGLIYQLLTAWIHTKAKLIEIQSLVGATDQHIMKPFIKDTLIWGLISFCSAVLLIIVFALLIASDMNSNPLLGWYEMGSALLILLIISEGVALISTYIIVNLYLKRFSKL